MVYKKKARAYKKKAVRKYKKKMMKNPLGKGIANQNKKMRVTIASTVQISASGVPAAGTAEYPQIAIPVNFPGHGSYWDGQASTAYGAINTLPNGALGALYQRFFTQLGIGSNSYLFEEYKVLNVRARFLPNAQITSTITSTITIQDQMFIYHINDPTDPTLYTTNIEQYYLDSGVRPSTWNNSTRKGVDFVYKQKAANKKAYLLCSSVGSAPNTPVVVSTTPFADPFATMKLCWKTSSNGAATGFLGQLFIEWDVIFKGLNFLG